MAYTISGSKSENEAIYKLAQKAYNYKSTSEGAVTLTVAELVNGVYVQTGTPGAVAKTTPIGEDIVEAIPEAVVGTTFEFVLHNGGDGTITFTAGATGVTLLGTATVAAGKNRRFFGIVTNVTTPAVTIVCLAALA